MVHSRPASARRQLVALLPRCLPGEPAEVLCHWGLGRLAHDAGDIDVALCHFDIAAHKAEAAGDAAALAGVLVSRALSLQAAGQLARALQDLDAAEGHATAELRGRLHGQRGFVLTVLGDPAAALTEYDAAIAAARSADDELALIRTLSNRGVGLMQMGRMTEAEADFEEMQVRASAARQHLLAAGARHNLGYLAGRRGDIAVSMRYFDQARQDYHSLGTAGRLVDALDVDHCEVLLDAGLTSEAVRLAERLVTAAPHANTLQRADALLLSARALWAAGHAGEAAARAAAAADLFGSDQRRPAEAVALYVGALAAPSRGSVRLIRRALRTLRQQGWHEEALVAQLQLGRALLAAGRTADAAGELDGVAEQPLHGSVRRRLTVLLARALRAQQTHDGATLRRVVRQAEQIVDAHRAGLGATDLRSAATALVAPMATIDLARAIDSGNAAQVLAASERWRTTGLDSWRFRRTMSSSRLGELRELHRRLAEARAGEGDTDASEVVASIEAAEAAITAEHRAELGVASPGRRRAVRARRLGQRLDGRVIVEFVEHGDQLYAVTMQHGSASLYRTCSTEEATSAAHALGFALRRGLMRPPTNAIVEAIDRAADDVQRLLLGPLALPDGEAVVVVPTGALHQVPWMCLRAARRAGGWTVTPSARWLADHGPADSVQRAAVIAGPGLPHAAAELRAVAACYRHPQVIATEATTASVTAALQQADVAHIAAHGTFRADNPLFSALLFDDGPLTVHDLMSLPSVPQRVVLSACRAARNDVLVGDELLGTSGALLGLGVRTVIAPVLEVPDESAMWVAATLHRRMMSSPPHVALARTVADAAAEADRRRLVTACAFVCLGCGD
jgi:tetratricopeptide (TPR) repeat protein